MCTGDTDVCAEPTDVCFVAIRVAGPTLNPVYEYACRGNNDHLNPFWQECLEGPIVQDFSSFQCCNNEDECNKNLDPPLPYALSKYATTTSDEDINPTVTAEGGTMA